MERESIIVVAHRPRDTGLIGCAWNNDLTPAALEAVCEAAQEATGPIVLGGGEPTLRADFPALVEALGARATVRTDALALHSAEVIKRMYQAGLRHVRVPIHSARADAHDWLVGLPGAHRRIRGAVTALRSQGIQVSAEVTLTGPTAPYLEETAAFLAKLGIRQIRFSMLQRLSESDNNYVSTAPRLGLMQPALDAAIRFALRAGADVELEGLPHCAIPGFNDLHIPTPEWIIPAGVAAPTARPSPIAGCTGCDCDGAPVDYTRIFGWSEFNSERADRPCPVMPVPHPESGEEACPPPNRAGRQPSTRVADALRLSDQANVGGDPLAGRSINPDEDVIAIRFPRSEQTRIIKQHLVFAAQQGPETLQIVGPLDHPEAFHLLREALRLSFLKVVITSDMTGLQGVSDSDLFKLREIDEVWTTTNPASIEVAQRLKEKAGVDYRAVRIEPDVPPVSLFGTPTFQASCINPNSSWPKWSPNAID